MTELIPSKSVTVNEFLDTASTKSSPSLSTPTRQLYRNRDVINFIMNSPASSLNSATPKRFDQRLKSHFSKISNTPTPSRRPAIATNHIEISHTAPNSLKWVNLDTLNNLLFSPHFKSIHGEPTCIFACDFIAIGTSKGYVLIFDYSQSLIHTLGQNTKSLISGKITVITVSLDSTHIASGFTNGDIFLWNLSSPSKPLVHIEAQKNSTNTVTDGHLKDSSINNLSFVGKSHSVFISSDINGMAFYHQCNRGVLGSSVSTRRVIGKYEDVINNVSNPIFACSALPLGSAIEVTDDKCLVAILTPSALVIISTTNNVRTQFKTGKPKIFSDEQSESGCLAWFPAMVLKNDTKSPAKLAYCFGNVLTVLEVTGNEDNLQFDYKKRWVADELILGIQWINQNLIAMITPTQQLILLNEKNLNIINTLDLISNHLYKFDFKNEKLTNNYISTFRTYKGRLFFVGKYEIFIGSNPNWINILLHLINKGEYIAAIELSKRYYLGTDDLDTAGLPYSDSLRQPLVLKYLTDIIKNSASHFLSEHFIETNGESAIDDLLYTSIAALVDVSADYIVFEEFFEIFEDHAKVELFFENLESFILSKQVKNLTIIILKNMINYYISVGKNETLERIICLLDIETLDIDTTIQLLKKNNLRDSYIFIWNKFLNDYITPFMEFILEIKEKKEDSSRIYVYLAYILTGRQYPTEDLIPEPTHTNAKLTLYFILFNGMPVTYENGVLTVDDDIDVECAFPYLYILLKHDSKAFLSVINECLEDSLMNDDEIAHQENKLKVNRQFIIEILIEVLNSNPFEDVDQLNFAIFIARNYPKFQQFIKLSERILDDVIKRLCKCEIEDPEVKEDCKLSLQSLLSVYHSPNKKELLEVFENAQFYEILINLYVNDRKFSKVLEFWLKSDKTNSIDTTESVLIRCYKSTENFPKERKSVNEVVLKNFEAIIEINTYTIVKIFNQYSPVMHKQSLKLEDAHSKYMYLSSLQKLESNGEYKLKVHERSEFIKSMSLFSKPEVLCYVKTLKNDDFDAHSLIDDLRKSGCVDTLVYLFNREGKFCQSLDEIINYMGELINKLPVVALKSDKEQLIHLEAQIWEYLKHGISLANSEISITQTEDNGLSLNEKMWLKLINYSVSCLKKFDKDGTPLKVVDILKRLIQDLFSSLINTRSQINSFELDCESGLNKYHSSFLKIFTEFLSSSTVKVTLLEDVRSVTNEMYLAFSYEQNTLTIVSKLINEGIYQSMQKLTKKNLYGWSVKSFECDACGRIIWGRGLGSDVYSAWEHEQRQSGSENATKQFDLITFNCRHCYHKSCLENLGNKNEYICVICDDK